MRRRDFIKAIAGSAAFWPLTAWAQQPLPVIGFLSSASPDEYAVRLRTFRQGLQVDWICRRPKRSNRISLGGRPKQSTADTCCRTGSPTGRHIVAAGGTPSAAAAKAVTATIPINFAVAVDPVEAGFVASLSHPGGNLTGVTNWNVEVGPKRLEVLHQLLPTATTVAVLVDPTSPALSDAFLRGLKIAAPTFGLQLYVLQASTGPDIDRVFASLDERQPGALIIGPSTFFNTRSQQLAALSLRHSMPAIYQFRPFVAAVGLISYGSDETEFYGLVGNYAGKILKGEKPADLPVVQTRKSN